MIFSTYTFILAFLPIVLLVYFGMSRYVSRKTQHLFLIAASLVFYGYANPWYVLLISTSIAANYSFALAIENTEKNISRKIVFILGILFNVGLLGYYKYYDFFVDNLNEVFGTSFVLKHMILPIGISFFTFQQIATLISIWKKEIKTPSFLNFSLFISFFPQLVAGPIVIAQDVISQYQDNKNRFFNIDNFTQGLYIFLIGLFKKVVIADSLNLITENVYNTPIDLSFGQAWIASLAFTLQIFFDFSGYSDMAIGLAKMFNINLPVNFYSPYKSKSITEFWKRWHITLGRSLAILIYFPLGGNRNGKARTCFNLFMVFLVSGIWHGAAWSFILWGVAHGVVRVFEKLFNKQLDRIPTVIRVFFTFMFVNAAWVLFAAGSIHKAKLVLSAMFVPEEISFNGISSLVVDGILTYPDEIRMIYAIGLIAGLLAIVFFYSKNSIDLYNSFKPSRKIAFVMAAIFCICVIHLSRVSPFIYFNF